MEKTLTINDVFYFINEVMERGGTLKATKSSSSKFCFVHKDFTIYCHADDKEIEIDDNVNNTVKLDITDLEAAQLRVVWEKVKLYSENILANKFSKYFTSGDNAIRTIDQIDD